MNLVECFDCLEWMYVGVINLVNVFRILMNFISIDLSTGVKSDNPVTCGPFG